MFKRPILIITVSYIIGILGGLYLKINIALFIFLVIDIFYISIYVYLKKRKKNYSNNINYKNFKLYNRIISIAIIVMQLSFLIIEFKEARFNNLFENITNIKFSGTIVEIKKESEYYLNYVVKVKDINNESKYKNSMILLKIKKNKKGNLTIFHYGDFIIGMGEYSKPELNRNYKGFNYSENLKQQGIYGICEVEFDNIKCIKKKSSFSINKIIYNVREKLQNNIFKMLSKDTASIAIAYLLGNTNYIDDDLKNMYSKANLSHILAISGMHLGYITVLSKFLLKKFSKKFSLYITMFILILFMNLTGCSVSVIRAVEMSVLFLISKLVYRRSDTTNNVYISCLNILMINPYYIFNLGFKLSFLGTIGIILFSKKIEEFIDSIIKYIYLRIYKFTYKKSEDKKKKTIFLSKLLTYIKKIMIVSMSANVLIIPVMVYEYNSFSIIFLVSSILITPFLFITFLIGYVCMFLSFFSINLSSKISILLNIFFIMFNKIANILSTLESLRIKVVTPSIFTVVIYYFIVFYIFYKNKIKFYKIIKKIILILLICNICVNMFGKINCKYRLYFIDVGQGDSSLIVTKHDKKILIDGGGSEQRHL